MIPRIDTRLLLSPGDVPPSAPGLQVVGAFNPGAADLGDAVLLLVRIAETPAETRPGQVGLPRWTTDAHGPHVVVDWVAQDTVRALDPRVVERRDDGMLRLTFTSHLLLVRSADGLSVTPEAIADATRLAPADPLEVYGIEDPRVTTIDGRHYVSYVAVSPHGAGTSLMVTDDFARFERLGMVFAPENKDVTLFPQRFGARYAALHRPNPRQHFHAPEMWLAASDNTRDWGGHRPLAIPASAAWRAGRIGGGCPPVRVPEGWLTIYHGNDKTARAPDQDVGTYCGGALLLDPDDPARVVAHTPEPFFVPEADFERRGFVPNVVFPTACLDRGDRWFIYYGAADTRTGVAVFDKSALAAALVPSGSP